MRARSSLRGSQPTFLPALRVSSAEPPITQQMTDYGSSSISPTSGTHDETVVNTGTDLPGKNLTLSGGDCQTSVNGKFSRLLLKNGSEEGATVGI